MELVITLCLIPFSVMLTAIFHYEGLRFLLKLASHRHTPRSTILLVLTGIVAVHFVEITYYALVYAVAAGPLALGVFDGATEQGFITMLHFSAETYSTLGYGDIVPKGDLRMLAGAEALNGLLLLAWSGSALFLLVQDLSASGGDRRR